MLYVKPEVGKTYIDSQHGEKVRILFKTPENRYIGEDEYGQLYKYAEDGESVFVKSGLMKEYKTIKFSFYIGLYDSGAMGEPYYIKNSVEVEAKKLNAKLLMIKHISEEIEL